MNLWRSVCVYTLGHSTHTLEELVALLEAFEISVLVDVRSVPRSRHNPQFNQDALQRALGSHGLRYVHLAELGGLRRARKDSPNTAWRNQSFRGFADYMLTGDFERGLSKLQSLARSAPVALMCAEAVPWRCHRSLIADALSVRGAQVEHITSPTHASPHHLTSFAKVTRTRAHKRVTYPGHEIARLSTRAPFHLEATVRVLQRRADNRVERWEDGKYLRVLSIGEQCGLVQVQNLGSLDRPDLRLELLAGELATNDAVDAVRKILGLDVNPTPLQRLTEAEPKLAPTARALRGMRPPRFANLMEAFLNVIPFQQVSLDAGIAIVGRVVERLGATLEHHAEHTAEPRPLRFYAYPRADVIATARLDNLKRCGLSRQKAEALRRLARMLTGGELDEARLLEQSSEDALQLLRDLPGIGPWSAALILLRGLGRIDVFPPGDVGVTRGLRTLLELPNPKALDELADRFGSRRGYLYFCSLGAALLERDLIHAAPPKLSTLSPGPMPPTAALTTPTTPSSRRPAARPTRRISHARVQDCAPLRRCRARFRS